jgi:hypothetical protein
MSSAAASPPASNPTAESVRSKIEDVVGRIIDQIAEYTVESRRADDAAIQGVSRKRAASRSSPSSSSAPHPLQPLHDIATNDIAALFQHVQAAQANDDEHEETEETVTTSTTKKRSRHPLSSPIRFTYTVNTSPTPSTTSSPEESADQHVNGGSEEVHDVSDGGSQEEVTKSLHSLVLSNSASSSQPRPSRRKLCFPHPSNLASQCSQPSQCHTHSMSLGWNC